MTSLDNQAIVTIVFKPEVSSRVLKKSFKGADARAKAQAWAKQFAASERAKDAQLLICRSECVISL